MDDVGFAQQLLRGAGLKARGNAWRVSGPGAGNWNLSPRHSLPEADRSAVRTPDARSPGRVPGGNTQDTGIGRTLPAVISKELASSPADWPGFGDFMIAPIAHPRRIDAQQEYPHPCADVGKNVLDRKFNTLREPQGGQVYG
jgi:hypothetical protein